MYADFLEPEVQAELDFDALPKDEDNYLTQLSKTRVEKLRRDHMAKRRGEGRPPQSIQDPIAQIRKVDLLTEAYRNRVAGEEFLKRDNKAQAEEFFALEKSFLEQAKEIV